MGGEGRGGMDAAVRIFTYEDEGCRSARSEDVSDGLAVVGWTR